MKIKNSVCGSTVEFLLRDPSDGWIERYLFAVWLNTETDFRRNAVLICNMCESVPTV